MCYRYHRHSSMIRRVPAPSDLFRGLWKGVSSIATRPGHEKQPPHTSSPLLGIRGWRHHLRKLSGWVSSPQHHHLRPSFTNGGRPTTDTVTVRLGHDYHNTTTTPTIRYRYARAIWPTRPEKRGSPPSISTTICQHHHASETRNCGCERPDRLAGRKKLGQC